MYVCTYVYRVDHRIAYLFAIKPFFNCQKKNEIWKAQSSISDVRNGRTIFYKIK
jgi:hypothetical protein